MSYGDCAFPGAAVDDLLGWGGVKRHVRTEDLQFNCLRKTDDTGAVYVAALRQFPGHYRNIWYDAEVEKRWERRATDVTLYGLADGAWRLDKLHRDRAARGSVTSANGVLSFRTDPACVAELQLYRLTPDAP